MQAYSDPSRETDPHSLPDVEIFPISTDDFLQAEDDTWMREMVNIAINESIPHDNPDITMRELIILAADKIKGYYWQPCFPGCLPDSDPIGPFETETEALADAQGHSILG